MSDAVIKFTALLHFLVFCPIFVLKHCVPWKATAFVPFVEV